GRAPVRHVAGRGLRAHGPLRAGERGAGQGGEPPEPAEGLRAPREALRADGENGGDIRHGQRAPVRRLRPSAVVPRIESLFTRRAKRAACGWTSTTTRGSPRTPAWTRRTSCGGRGNSVSMGSRSRTTTRWEGSGPRSRPRRGAPDSS